MDGHSYYIFDHYHAYGQRDFYYVAGVKALLICNFKIIITVTYNLIIIFKYYIIYFIIVYFWTIHDINKS